MEKKKIVIIRGEISKTIFIALAKKVLCFEFALIEVYGNQLNIHKSQVFAGRINNNYDKINSNHNLSLKCIIFVINRKIE